MPVRKIVVIDDEKDLAFLMQELLQKNCECEVLVAHDGEAGEDLCIRTNPDVIFIDYLMPRRKGDTVIKNLVDKGLARKAAIVMMSGMVELATSPNAEQKTFFDQLLRAATVTQRHTSSWTRMPVEFVEQYGVTAFLPKPFNKKILLGLVQDLQIERK